MELLIKTPNKFELENNLLHYHKWKPVIAVCYVTDNIRDIINWIMDNNNDLSIVKEKELQLN